MKIRKAVIPAAGIGTRFLPWTKTMPKEMLPIVDKPVIQYVVEECVASGIKEIIIVISKDKQAIKNYFKPSPCLEKILKKQGKTEKLQEIKKINSLIKFTFIEQIGPYGNAIPVLSARKAVGNNPFAVLWGDQFMVSKPPRLKQCLKVFNKYQLPLVGAIKTSKKELVKRGVCQIRLLRNNIYQLIDIIEKPDPEKAPSNLVAGAYLFTPQIFPILKNLKPGKDGEYWLVDAISKLCKKTAVLAVEIKNAKFYDAGNTLNYHKTIIDFMLEDKDIGREINKYMKGKII